MNKQLLAEISRISTDFEISLHSYVGEFNDELTRAQITEELRRYITDIRKLVHIPVDLGKIGLSKLLPYNHGEIIPNDYTIATFKVISEILASDQVS